MFLIKYEKLEGFQPAQMITIVATAKNMPVTVEMRPLFIWARK